MKTSGTLRVPLPRRAYRQDALFVVATEDTFAAKQYFDALSFERSFVWVVETPPHEGASPSQVLDRLVSAVNSLMPELRAQYGDSIHLWLVPDTDHYIKGTHAHATSKAVREARHRGIRVAFSNPCFEIWLLLHVEDVGGNQFATCAEVIARLRRALGAYDKTSICAERFAREPRALAVQRARALDAGAEADWWPTRTGTHVYRLIEALEEGEPA